jgi:restriction system protein
MQEGDPEFREFQQPSRHKIENHDESSSDVIRTPREVMDAGYQEMRRDLSQELLNRIKSSPPRFFEHLVVDLLVAMGYGGSRKDAGEAVGQSGDGGVDGIIKEDKLGLDAIYLQAKRWEGTVGRPVVQAFAGSLEGHRARKGVLITTSQFSPEALDYVTRIVSKIVLIDGEELAKLMIDYGIGVADDVVYEIKRLDTDYFEEEV